MKRVILLCLLCVPATAADPTIDQLVQAYAAAPWVLVPTQDGEKFYCIAERDSHRVDWIVTKIAEAAKGAKCS